MQMLVNPRKTKTKVHLWDGSDTLCHQYSAGALDPARHEVVDDARGRSVCKICQSKAARRATSTQGYEKREKQRKRAKAARNTKDFPKHVLTLQEDGTYIGEPVTFHVSRWKGRESK